MFSIVHFQININFDCFGQKAAFIQENKSNIFMIRLHLKSFRNLVIFVARIVANLKVKKTIKAKNVATCEMLNIAIFWVLFKPKLAIISSDIQLAYVGIGRSYVYNMYRRICSCCQSNICSVFFQTNSLY